MNVYCHFVIQKCLKGCAPLGTSEESQSLLADICTLSQPPDKLSSPRVDGDATLRCSLEPAVASTVCCHCHAMPTSASLSDVDEIETLM